MKNEHTTRKKAPAGRYALLDELRGLDLVSMMLYHACWDMMFLFGIWMDWYAGMPGRLWQQTICWVFILLSGFCAPFGRHMLRRGVTVFAAGALVTAVTLVFMPGDRVIFGVLTFLGTAMLLTGVLEPLLKKVMPAVGLAVSAVLFAVCYPVGLGWVGLGGWKLMLPQSLNDVWAEISYKIVYDNGSQSAYSARVNLAKVKVALRNSTTTSVEQIDRWNPNFVYNYYFAFDPSKPNTDSWTIDYNGSTGGDGTPIEGATLVQDGNGNFIGVDIDGDGQADYPLAWEDIDGDGKEEGGIDRDGDGHIDNVDGENVNHADPSSPAYGSVTVGNANNPGGGDVILIDTDGDGICETQLENPLPISTAIEFSAEIEEWEGTYDAVVDAQ